MLFSDRSTPLNIDQAKKKIELRKDLIIRYKGELLVENQKINDSENKIAVLRGDIDSLTDKIRRFPRNLDVKVWKRTRMSMRLAWLAEKKHHRELLPCIQQIHCGLSHEAVELSSLLASVNQHQENEILGLMHLSSTQEDPSREGKQLAEPSATNSGPALEGKIIPTNS